MSVHRSSSQCPIVPFTPARIARFSTTRKRRLVAFSDSAKRAAGPLHRNNARLPAMWQRFTFWGD
jgi:hypothetical protein